MRAHRGLAIIALSALASVAACVIERAQPAENGQHPEGWMRASSPDFHGKYLRSTGDDLSPCRVCHGDDYQGGPVQVGCTTAGCHEKGPEQCDTCHGKKNDPRPSTGAHAEHAGYCTECHKLPGDWASHDTVDGHVLVVFSGLAVANNAVAAWVPNEARCAGTYCHGSGAPVWKASGPEPAPCDSCHAEPPSSHDRFAFVAPKGSCATCHPTPNDGKHINASIDINAPLACSTCHGHGDLGVPAPALDGSSDVTKPGTGAHARHTDDGLADRMSPVVGCDRCHIVPATVLAQGHLDMASPADVTLKNGESYDAQTGRCNADCHFNRSPGPMWTDASGAARACDACHGFPPVKLRDGTSHTPAAPSLASCLSCHPFDPARHADGIVDVGP